MLQSVVCGSTRSPCSSPMPSDRDELAQSLAKRGTTLDPVTSTKAAEPSTASAAWQWCGKGQIRSGRSSLSRSVRSCEIDPAPHRGAFLRKIGASRHAHVRHTGSESVIVCTPVCTDARSAASLDHHQLTRRLALELHGNAPRSLVDTDHHAAHVTSNPVSK